MNIPFHFRSSRPQCICRATTADDLNDVSVECRPAAFQLFPDCQRLIRIAARNGGKQLQSSVMSQANTIRMTHMNHVEVYQMMCSSLSRSQSHRYNQLFPTALRLSECQLLCSDVIGCTVSAGGQGCCQPPLALACFCASLDAKQA